MSEKPIELDDQAFSDEPLKLLEARRDALLHSVEHDMFIGNHYEETCQRLCVFNGVIGRLGGIRRGLYGTTMLPEVKGPSDDGCEKHGVINCYCSEPGDD